MQQYMETNTIQKKQAKRGRQRVELSNEGKSA